MHRFEVIKGEPTKVRLEAGTRAGLSIAALQGMFAASEAESVVGAEMVERAFSVEATEFPALLAAFLSSAADTANQHGEVYEDVHFDLMTDKKATGSFSGRAMQKSVRIPNVQIDQIEIKKTDAGWVGMFWE